VSRSNRSRLTTEAILDVKNKVKPDKALMTHIMRWITPRVDCCCPFWSGEHNFDTISNKTTSLGPQHVVCSSARWHIQANFTVQEAMHWSDSRSGFSRRSFLFWAHFAHVVPRTFFCHDIYTRLKTFRGGQKSQSYCWLDLWSKLLPVYLGNLQYTSRVLNKRRQPGFFNGK
jgi:hypothetical protein